MMEIPLTISVCFDLSGLECKLQYLSTSLLIQAFGIIHFLQWAEMLLHMSPLGLIACGLGPPMDQYNIYI